MAGKYGLSTETVRWYLEALGDASRNAAVRGSRAARRLIGGVVLNGIATTLAGTVKRAAEKALKRAGALKELLPKLAAEQRFEARLKQLQRKVAQLTA